MDSKPSFLDIYFDFLLSWETLIFILPAIIFLSFPYKTYKEFRGKEKMELKDDKKFVYWFLLIFGVILLTVNPIVTIFFTMSSQDNELKEIHTTSEANKEWFLQNSEILYKDLKEKEFKVLKVSAVEKMKDKKLINGMNEDLKEILMYESMKEFSGKETYLINALIENENKEKEEIKMLVTIDIAGSNENLVSLKNTSDNKEDMGERVLYGTFVLNDQVVDLITE